MLVFLLLKNRDGLTQNQDHPEKLASIRVLCTDTNFPFMHLQSSVAVRNKRFESEHVIPSHSLTTHDQCVHLICHAEEIVERNTDQERG